MECVGKGWGQRGNGTAGGFRIGEGCVSWKQPSQGHFSIYFKCKNANLFIGRGSLSMKNIYI